MIAVGLELRRSRASSRPRSSTRISWLCWPSVGAGVRSQRSTDANRNGSVGVALLAHDRVVDLLVEPARLQLRVVVHRARVAADRRRARRVRRAARPPRRRRARAHHALEVRRRARRDGPAGRRTVASAGSVAHAGSPERVDAAPRHCSSVATEIASHVSSTATRVQALRRDVRAAVAVALEQVAVRGLLDHQLGGGVERALDHRHLEEAAAPGRLALGEPDEQRERRVHARVRVARALLDAGLVVGVAGDPREPGDLLHRLREADVVAPRARQPERGHAHEDAPRVDAPGSCSQSSPKLPSTRGEKFSSTASLSAIRPRSSASPSSVPRSSVRSRLFVFEHR